VARNPSGIRLALDFLQEGGVPGRFRAVVEFVIFFVGLKLVRHDLQRCYADAPGNKDMLDGTTVDMRARNEWRQSGSQWIDPFVRTHTDSFIGDLTDHQF
jgi:hypothetical protein